MKQSLEQELNILKGVYALSDPEMVVIDNTMQEIAALEQRASQLTGGMLSAIAKFAGIFNSLDADFYAFGAVQNRMIVFDTRIWTIDKERGLVLAERDEAPDEYEFDIDNDFEPSPPPTG